MMYDIRVVTFVDDGVRENIDKYLNGMDTDWAFIKEQFVINPFGGRLSSKWYEMLDPGRVIGFGSDLYLCDRETLVKLLDMDNITMVYDKYLDRYDENMEVITEKHEIPVSEIPIRDSYGIIVTDMD